MTNAGRPDAPRPETPSPEDLLAAHLAAAGFASLRYDPRGKGSSAAGPQSLTAFRDDARAALTALAGSANIDTSRLYLLSLGAGSTIAIDLLASGDGNGAAVKGYIALAPLVNDAPAAFIYAATSHMQAAGFSKNFISHQTKPIDDAIKAMQVALNIGMDARFVLEAPLMWIDKAATWALAQEIGGSALVDIIRNDTHTCYLGERGALHEWGHGCGQCPACKLRADGFARWRASKD